MFTGGIEREPWHKFGQGSTCHHSQENTNRGTVLTNTENTVQNYMTVSGINEWLPNPYFICSSFQQNINETLFQELCWHIGNGKTI